MIGLLTNHYAHVNIILMRIISCNADFAVAVYFFSSPSIQGIGAGWYGHESRIEVRVSILYFNTVYV